jgi:hypothetical protein
MNALTRLDSRRRGVFPPTFRPGDTLAVEAAGADFVTFKLQKPAQARLVQPRQRKGRWFGAEVTLDRRAMAAAVRVDRDSR